MTDEVLAPVGFHRHRRRSTCIFDNNNNKNGSDKPGRTSKCHAISDVRETHDDDSGSVVTTAVPAVVQAGLIIIKNKCDR